MPYVAEISRANPACLVFVIDQSTSMGTRLNGGRSKAQFLSDVVNRTIYTLVINSTKADGVRDYFHVGLISYSGQSSQNALPGQLSAQTIWPISHLANNPVRVEERIQRANSETGEVVERRTKLPVWLVPAHRGRTPMCAGLKDATTAVRLWSAEHQNSFPPLVLHVTDGHPTDGDPEPVASLLKQVFTKDGTCLLLNLHLDVEERSEIAFPSDESILPDKYAKKLFRMSSILPAEIINSANARGFHLKTGSRGFIYNAGAEGVISFFDIGTRPNLINTNH